ncbi:MAG: hypothetical protein JXQ83_07490 [Candidatus Glassbacteria bacterium]|nr:hypothetical protein [Candidatus Glassbacteria bacterium]
MDSVVYGLLIINLLAGFGCALPLARVIRQSVGVTMGLPRLVAVLVGIYFCEGLALGMGMTIPVFSVGLAFIWGIVFGFRLRGRAGPPEVLRVSFFLSLYSSLPAVSLLVIPALARLEGWSVLSTPDGIRFGIPEFLHLPWPLGTILGFYASLVTGAVILKILITTGEVSLLLRGAGPKAPGRNPA